MPVTIQFLRDNDDQSKLTTLNVGELQVNTSTKGVIVHDGITQGGLSRSDKVIPKTAITNKSCHVVDGVIVNNTNVPIRTIGFNMTDWTANDLIQYNYSGFNVAKVNINLNMTTDFTSFNALLSAAAQANVGIIPVLFDSPSDFRTMASWASDFVTAYNDNQTIVGWEIGTAWNEVLSQDILRYTLQAVAIAVRKADTQSRMISSGNTKSSKADGTWSDFVEHIILDNPYPIDTVSIHAYPLSMDYIDPDMLLLEDMLTQLNKQVEQSGKALLVGGVAKGWHDAGSDTIYTQGFSVYDRIVFALYRSGAQLSFINTWNTTPNVGYNVHPTHTNGSKHVIDIAANYNEKMRDDGYVASSDIDSSTFETTIRPSVSTTGSFTFYGDSECTGTVDADVLPKYESSLVTSASGATIGGVSASFWLCGDPTIDSTVDHDILVKETSIAGFAIRWQASTGRIHGYIKGSGDSWEVYTRPWDPKTEGWTHFVIQLDDVKSPEPRRHGGQAYVNGALSGYAPCPTNFTYTAVGPWVSGMPNKLNDGMFTIADIRVFDRTLWSSEVYNVYVNGTNPARACRGRWRFVGTNATERLASDNENFSGEELTVVNVADFSPNQFILTRTIIGE